MLPEGPYHPAAETPGHPSWLAPVKPVVPDHDLLRRIGGGSYGDVWLARTTVGTWRAVKVVFRDRFLDSRPYEREFNGIQKFEPLSRGNEGFVDILQIGRNDAEGYFYYVMELADNANGAGRTQNEELGPGLTSPTTGIDPANYVPKTLSKVLLQRGRLPVAECLELGLTLNLGLAHLHRAGLIHRDIKPSNIIFVGGVPKLADIGLVIEVAEARSYVGTEGFIPPEGPNSPQADLYSLGKVLYEAGMGKDRKDFPEPFTQIAEAPDSAQLLELNAILLKACAASVSERYQSAEEMNADLALLQSGGSVRRQRKLAGQLRFVQRAGAIIIALAALIALAWWWQLRQTREKALLAAEAQRNELIARQNLYAADMNLAHQALLANNLRQARVLLQKQVPEPGQPDLRGFEWRYLWEQSRGQELFSLRGHTNTGRVTAFSPDGQRLAVGGEDGTTMVFAIDTRREIASLNLTGEVRSVSFSTNQNLLAIATANSVSVLDSHALSLLRRLPEAGWYSPDGEYLLTCGRSPLPPNGILHTSKLVLWDAASWKVVNTLELPMRWRQQEMTEAGSWAAFAPDGKHVAVILADAIRLFSIPDLLASSALPQVSNAGASSKPFVRFSPDNNMLATLDSTGFGVRLWNTAQQREVRILSGHSDHVLAVSFSPDGRRLASCGADQTIKLWNVPSGELVRTFKGQAEEVTDVAFSPDGKSLASVGADGVIKLWNANTTQKQEHFREPSGPVGFSMEGGLVAFGEMLNPVVLDPSTLQVKNTGFLNLTNGRAYVPHFNQTRSGRKTGTNGERWYYPYLGNFSPDGRTVGLFEFWEQAMDIWDLREGRLLCSVGATKPWVAFAPKRQLVATDTINATTTVWQLPSGTLKWVFTNRVGLFQAIAFSPDENFIVTDEGTCMKLWQIERQDVKPLMTFNPKRWPVIGLAFSPDGRLLATGESGGPIKLWTMPSVQSAGVLSGHTRSVIALAFSADGRTLASMCDDRTVRLWHVATQRELLRFQAPKDDHYYFSLAFSPDGRALAARRIDDEGSITSVWHAPSLADIESTETGN